jgi:hypothetical protein
MEGTGALTGALILRKFAGVSHDVHENARTYWKFGRVVMDGMELMIKDLSKRGECGAEKRGINN